MTSSAYPSRAPIQSTATGNLLHLRHLALSATLCSAIFLATAAPPAAAGSGCYPGDPKPTPANCPAGETRPNVVFIMLDDLGYADLAPYGRDFLPPGATEHWISTPRVDEISDHGIRFTQFYAAPACTPTRVSLLSGSYQQRLNVRRQFAVFTPTFRGVPDFVLALPAMLANAGYATGHFGKWHAGFGRAENRPLALGFDEACTLDEAIGLRYCDPGIRDSDDPVPAVVAGLTTETLFDYAESFVERHAGTGCPFFLQLWPWAPHGVLDFTDGQGSSCAGTCPAGCLDQDPATPCPVEEPLDCYVQRYNQVPGLVGAVPSYGAIISKVDEQIGLLWEKLESFGLADNTLLIVASDNGGIFRPPSIPTPTNGDLTGIKGQVLEGGVRIPFIARWNDGIALADRGSDHDRPVMRFELYPTLAELAGVSLSTLVFDGESFADVFNDPQTVRATQTLAWEYQPSVFRYDEPNGIYNDWAVRRGRWKLVYVHEGDDRIPAKRLFDFTVEASTPAQTYSEEAADDVAAAHPDVVAALDEDFLDWRRAVGLLPLAVSHDLDTGPGTYERVGRDLRMTGSGGFARLDDATLHDFNDGSFTFAVRVLPAPGSLGAGEKLIAGKSGSWEIEVLPSRQVRLRVWDDGQPAAPALELTSQTTLSEGQWSWVAMDVYGWRNDQAEIRLHVDGEVVEEVPTGGAGFAVTAVASNANRVWIGGDFSGSRNFAGVLRDAELYVASLVPEELWRLRTGEALFDDFEDGTLAAWDAILDPAPSAISVTAGAALFGDLGLAIAVQGGERRFITTQKPQAATRHRSSFRVDLSMANLTSTGQRIWVARSADVYPYGIPAMILARDHSGTGEVQGWARLDDGGWVSTDWLALGGDVGSVEIEWRAADTVFGDGLIALRVLDGESQELRGIDNDGWILERVDLGVVSTAVQAGDYRFDLFESYDY